MDTKDILAFWAEQSRNANYCAECEREGRPFGKAHDGEHTPENIAVKQREIYEMLRPAQPTPTPEQIAGMRNVYGEVYGGEK